MLNQILETAAFIRAKVGQFTPEVGIILGTGLGDFADNIEVKYAIEYKEIPNFPVSTVEGHKGRLIFGEINGRRVVAMQGRFHYYEGYTAAEIGGILGAGRNTVLTWLARGRQALRERMIGGFDDDTI